MCVVVVGCLGVEILQEIRDLPSQLQGGHAFTNLDRTDDLLGYIAARPSRHDRSLQLLRLVGISFFHESYQSSTLHDQVQLDFLNTC